MSEPLDDGTLGDRLSPAGEAFAEFLALRERGEPPDFESFCAGHPDLEDALRRMHARWRDVEGALGSRGGAAPPHPAIRTCPSDRYRDPERIGRGGMGEVERVWDQDLGRYVARKILAGDGDDPSTPSPSDPRTLGRFLAEAHVTARLEHPGIVPVHELGIDEHGRVYFTMAWIRGESLRELLPRIHDGSDGWSRTGALQVLLRVCEAVAFAHDRGVLHRDLKPSNIMVGRFGEVFVVDWGLARFDAVDPDSGVPLPAHLGAPDGGRTLHGDVVGTPAYMAPEQALGDHARVGPAADVYALGAILYEVLSGRAPHVERSAARADEILARVRRGPPVPLAPGSAPPELIAIQERAMAREPDARYPNVAALAEDLRAFLELRVVRAYRTGALVELGKWVRRNRGVAAAAAAALVAIVAGLVLALAARHEAEDQAGRAHRALATALDSVERMLTRVATETLARVPESGPVRRQLLDDALELHDGLVALDESDLELRSRAALARSRAAELAASLGDSRRAEILQREAVGALRELAAAAPDDPSRAARLCACESTLAGQLAEVGRIEDARAVAAMALEHAASAQARFGDEPELLRRIALLHEIDSFVAQRAGDHAAALAASRRALPLWEQLAALDPGDAVLATRVVRAGVSVATALLLVDDDDGAERAYRDALARVDGLLEAHGDHPDVRRETAWAARSFAVFLISVERVGEARDMLAIAVERARARVDELPGEPVRWTELAVPLQLTGRLQVRARQIDDGVRNLEAALDAARIGYRTAPGQARAADVLQSCARELANLALRLQRHQLATRCAEELASLRDGELPARRAAQLYSLAIPLVRADDQLPADRRAQLDHAYAARCIELLGEALRRGFAEPAVFDRSEWAAIRDLPEVAEVRRAAAANRDAGSGR
ncbi:MAG: protein kinase [Planctomycetes bacterium]|nr:protein kinase [Planctomycetota bacterium]